MYKIVKLTINGQTCETLWRVADSASIPFDTANTDYQAYLKWLEEGNQPLPADQPSQE